ncbi:hypothetical protein HHI36_000759 [Cryptolaemus montrouzieri]|uniref:Uncharacterized protein n=1 Tax=Cryptolaemus montrouzieri TaxID=559131 RepID=A0ABD2P5F6_9CUCU
MPRNYQRKPETKYELVDLEKVVEASKNKTVTQGKLAIIYYVTSNIQDYLDKANIKAPKTGKKAIFTQEQEEELEDHILKCYKKFYGLTIERISKTAFTFDEVYNFKQKNYRKRLILWV